MINIKTQNSKSIITSAILLALSLFAIFGTPYRFADKNSGRYLPAVYRIIDPSLFQHDPVADAFERFESLFYSGMGVLLSIFHVSALEVEPVFYLGYVLSKIILLVLIYFLVRSLNQNAWAFLLLGAWVSHLKAASVGGGFLFEPSLTHATVATLLGLGALIFLIKENYIGFWITLSVALFSHSLIATHLGILIFLGLVWQTKTLPAKTNVIGFVIFAVFFLLYLKLMTPPSFTIYEQRLFLSMKGDMNHISPLSQSGLEWLSMAGRILLAWFVHYLYFQKNKSLSQLRGFMISGSVLAITLGLAAIQDGFPIQLAQLQPMRMFEWVNLFAFILLACAIVSALKENPLTGSLLLIIFLLNILDSLWAVIWLYFGITVLAIQIIQTRFQLFSTFSRKNYQIGSSAFLAILALVIWIFSNYHSFESFKDPVPVIVIILCLLPFWIPANKHTWQAGILIMALGIALLSRSFYLQNYISQRQDTDFNLICKWIALNTSKSDQFITAVISPSNFRARALRTTLNEPQSALYWIAPQVGVENGISSQQVLSAWDGRKWNMKDLFVLSKEWNAKYILVEGNYSQEGLIPIYVLGKYSVFESPSAKSIVKNDVNSRIIYKNINGN